MKSLFTTLLLLFSTQIFTQTIDATVSGGEYAYGPYTGTGNGDWHMTWDDDFLYIALLNANESEGAIIYLDFDSEIPVNSGAGNNFGITHFGLTPDLPFNADAHVFFNNTNRAIYRASGGTWGAPIYGDDASGLQGGNDDYTEQFYASNDNGDGQNANDRREIKIAWNDLTNGNGRPTEFNWFGYVAFNNGIYGDIPESNPDGNFSNGDTPDMTRYFTVSNTDVAGQIGAFERESYTHIGGNIANFGAIAVYDFTMNTPGIQVARTNPSDNGNWNIVNLNVGAGEVFFGLSGTFGTTTITGDVNVVGGTLDMDQTTQPMIVSGSVVVENGGTLNLSNQAGGDMEIGEDFDMNGNFNCRDRAVTFNGSAEQTIGGTGIEIDFFILNNANNIAIDGEVTIDDELTFTNGKILLGNNDLTLDNTGTVTGAGMNNYIVTNNMGAFKRNAGGFFPVGTTTSYAPANLTITGTADIFSVKVDNTVRGNVDAAKIVNLEWDINEMTPGGNDVTLELQWNASDEAANFDRAGMVVIGHYDGTDWDESSAVVAGSNPYTATAPNFDTFSPFAIANQAALPVELVRFTAEQQENAHVLEWITASEINNAYFEIQHSINSNDWITLDKVTGAGTSFKNNAYHFTNQNPVFGQNYYRLKQVDYDGQFEFSTVVALNFRQENTVEIFPNPVVGELFFKFKKEEIQTVNANIYNANGQLVISKIMVDASLNVANLPTGLYFLQLSDVNGTTILQQQFLKR